MIDVLCRTNLDLLTEVWPTKLPHPPAVGDLIQSNHEWMPKPGSTYHLELEVVRRTWKFSRGDAITTPGWYLEVEMGLPHTRYETMKEFYEWYGKITGKGRSFFI